MRFLLPSIKCSAAPPSFRLCYLNCAQRFDLITARSAVVGSRKEPPNIWLTVAKNAFVGWALNFRIRMILKGAVIDLITFILPVVQAWTHGAKKPFLLGCKRDLLKSPLEVVDMFSISKYERNLKPLVRLSKDLRNVVLEACLHES